MTRKKTTITTILLTSILITTLLAAKLPTATAGPVILPTITEFTVPTPGSFPNWIEKENNTSLWFTEAHGTFPTSQIARFIPGGGATGTFTEYTRAPGYASNPYYGGIGVRTAPLACSGTTPEVWFTETDASVLAVLLPSLAPPHMFEFVIPPAGAAAQPNELTIDPAGNIWFAESSTDTITEFHPVCDPSNFLPTTGFFLQYPLPAFLAPHHPVDVAADPSLPGDVWFTDFLGNRIGQLAGCWPVGPCGAMTLFNVAPLGTTSSPGSIEIVNGKVWFTDTGAPISNRLWKLDPTAPPAIAFSGHPDTIPSSQAFGITHFGPQVWFTAQGGLPSASIGRCFGVGMLCTKNTFPEASITGLVLFTNTTVPGTKFVVNFASTLVVGISLPVTCVPASCPFVPTIVQYYTTSLTMVGSLPIGIVATPSLFVPHVWFTEQLANRLALFDPPPLQGDVNSDGRVDVLDLAVVAMAFGSRSNSPNWKAAADINNDGVADIQDVAIVAMNYGAAWN